MAIAVCRGKWAGFYKQCERLPAITGICADTSSSRLYGTGQLGRRASFASLMKLYYICVDGEYNGLLNGKDEQPIYNGVDVGGISVLF